MSRLGLRRGWPVWAAVLFVALWALVRAFGLERGFPLVPLLAYTPYVAATSILVAGVALALRNWLATGVAVLAAAVLVGAVAPRMMGGATGASPGGAALSVLSANIHHGTADPDALMALVRRHRPDVLTVQELTPAFAAKLRRAGIHRVLPHEVLSVRRSASGAGIYSRLPMQRVPEPQAFPFRMPRAGIIVAGNRLVRLVDVHPYPPQQAMLDRWKAALESLPSAGPGDLPWILSGDFNATLDIAELRDILDRGYRDAGDVMGGGLTPTWPAGRILPPPVTIDHILADRRIGILDYGVEDLPGSDHRAIYARLSIP